MNWIGIVLGAVVGALTAVIFAPVIKKIWKTDKAQRIVFVLVFAFALSLSRELLQPVVYRHYEAYSLDDELQKNPAFVTLKAYDASSYEDLLKTLKSQITSGASVESVGAAAQAKIQTIIYKRLPQSSDDAAIAYMRVMIDEIQHLYNGGSDRCYVFLFPSADSPQYLKAEDLPKSLRDRDAQTLSEVLRTSLVSPQKPPTAEQFQAALSTPFVQEFVIKNGAALDQLEKPKLTLSDRRGDCLVTMGLYRELFKLPVREAGAAIRHMLGVQS